MDYAAECVHLFLWGAYDSWRYFPRALRRVSEARPRVLLNLLLLNGALVVGMHSLFSRVVQPLGGSPALMLLAWDLPVYCLSLVANWSRSGELARGLVSRPRPQSAVDAVLRLSVILGLSLALLVSLWVPVVGGALYFFLYSWFYALCAFEAVWSSQGREYRASLDVFECRWLYFFGFGASLSALSIYVSPTFFVSYALVSLYLPLLTATSMGVDPEQIPRQRLVPRLVLIAIVDALITRPFSDRLLSKLTKRKSKRRVVG